MVHYTVWGWFVYTFWSEGEVCSARYSLHPWLQYDSTVKEGRLYDCGVELTTEGRYGRPDYLHFVTHRPLSLHSLYLALWTNFAGFCMALISQADGQKKISRVLSSWQPIRHYCVTQLRSLWLHMGNNMRLTLEEQSFFVMKCMETLLKVSWHSLPIARYWPFMHGWPLWWS